MKRIILLTITLFSLLLASACGALAQAATPTQNGNITIINEGNVLSANDVDSVRSLASNFPLPLVIYITNQYHGAKIDFSRKVAKLVTENNVVIGISTYKDNNENDRYRLIGAGPKAGISANMLDGAQNAADQYLRAAQGPQYVSAITAIIGYLEGGLGNGSTSAGNGSQPSGSGQPASSGSGFWGNIGLILLVLFGLWLAFIFVRWLWRQAHPMPAGQQRPSGAASEGEDHGRGYVGGGPVFYPIWLGGGSYGDGGGSLSLGGGGGAATPPAPDAGGGSFASAFGGGGGGGAASSNAGGGTFESSFAPGGGGSRGSSSSAGGGGFESVVNAAGATGGAEAAGAIAGAAVNILGGILGAVFSSGSGGSGPDF
ncbi:MAG: hypothetical protein DLM69_06850 [Candidatus Chloroheliales bacterium]|nr:MAG: hypothetical protein DLM69_06850 [Chloroflexota bacterium]